MQKIFPKIIELATKQKPVWSNETRIGTPGRKKWANNSWYRGEHMRFGPNVADFESADAIEKYIVEGWAPPAPFISQTTKVTAFGSCFAEHIGNWLKARKYQVLTKEGGDAYIVVCAEGMVNTFAILGQFEWALENKVPQSELWHGFDATAFGYKESIRRQTQEIFLSTDVFVLTFGLSEIWYDEPTGEVFWRAVPYDKFDPKRHKFRLSTVDENTRNIRKLYQLIRKYRPEAKIIFTLSPIPLVATFRNMPCLSANHISKAILRVSIDNVLTEFGPDGNLFYWPSYEIVMEAFQDRWRKDRRHVKREILDYIMMLFEKTWCTLPPTPAELEDALVSAQVAVGSPMGQFAWHVRKGGHGRAEAMLAKWKKMERHELVNFALRWREEFLAQDSGEAKRYSKAGRRSQKKSVSAGSAVRARKPWRISELARQLFRRASDSLPLRQKKTISE